MPKRVSQAGGRRGRAPVVSRPQSVVAIVHEGRPQDAMAQRSLCCLGVFRTGFFVATPVGLLRSWDWLERSA